MSIQHQWNANILYVQIVKVLCAIREASTSWDFFMAAVAGEWEWDRVRDLVQKLFHGFLLLWLWRGMQLWLLQKKKKYS